MSAWSVAKSWDDILRLHRELSEGGYQIPGLPADKIVSPSSARAVNDYFTDLLSKLPVDLSTCSGPQPIRQFLQPMLAPKTDDGSVLNQQFAGISIGGNRARNDFNDSSSHFSQSLPADSSHFNLAPLAPRIKPINNSKPDLPPIIELPPSPSPSSFMDQTGRSVFQQRPTNNHSNVGLMSSSVPANFIFRTQAAGGLSILSTLGEERPTGGAS